MLFSGITPLHISNDIHGSIRGGGGAGGPGPTEISQSYGVLFRTVPDLLKNHKAFNVWPSSARQGNAISF